MSCMESSPSSELDMGQAKWPAFSSMSQGLPHVCRVHRLSLRDPTEYKNLYKLMVNVTTHGAQHWHLASKDSPNSLLHHQYHFTHLVLLFYVNGNIFLRCMARIIYEDEYTHQAFWRYAMHISPSLYHKNTRQLLLTCIWDL